MQTWRSLGALNTTMRPDVSPEIRELLDQPLHVIAAHDRLRADGDLYAAPSRTRRHRMTAGRAL